MFDSLWINLHAATMTGSGDAFGIINNAAIGITDAKIAYIGAQKDLPGAPATLSDDVRDGMGRFATPGLIDCHTHLVYAGNRADEFEKRLKGVSYADIAAAGGGILSTVSATRAASENALADLAITRAKQLFREGVTTIEIKSGYGLDLMSERKILLAATRVGEETGLRVRRSFLGAHALPPEFSGQPDEYVEELCREILPALADEGLIDAVDGFCENIAFSREQIKKVFDTAKKLGLPVKLHAEQLSNQRGAEMAAKYGALSADHLEYLDEAGAKAMGKSGTVAVLLPGAFYHLREKQLPPVDLLRKHGVPIAIATDHNPGTSPTLSLQLMLNMGCTLFGLTPEEALLGVTRHAAKALGISADCGTLERGKDAEIALWDIAHPREICSSFGANACAGVILSGAYYDFAA